MPKFSYVSVSVDGQVLPDERPGGSVGGGGGSFLSAVQANEKKPAKRMIRERITYRRGGAGA
jgi:hypothetical protein